jgi:hypothetical protein
VLHRAIEKPLETHPTGVAGRKGASTLPIMGRIVTLRSQASITALGAELHNLPYSNRLHKPWALVNQLLAPSLTPEGGRHILLCNDEIELGNFESAQLGGSWKMV